MEFFPLYTLLFLPPKPKTQNPKPMHLIDKLAWIEIQDCRILSTRSRGKDVWYLPGGKREPGESNHEALIREIREELSVELLPETLSHIGNFEDQAHGHAEGVLVKMQCYSGAYTGTLKPAAEIAEMDWLATADMHRISPVDNIIFAHLKKEGKID